MGTELPVWGDTPTESVDSLLACGARAVDLDGALCAGREWYEAAYREGERTGDPAVLARAALGAAGWWLGEQRTAAASALVRARLRHALALLDPDSTLAQADFKPLQRFDLRRNHGLSESRDSR